MNTKAFVTTALLTLLTFAFGGLAQAQARTTLKRASATALPAVVIKMNSDMKFVPKTITIAHGQTVEFKNTSQDFHNAVDDPQHAGNPTGMALPKGAKPFDTGYLKAGDTYRHTFTVPGTYHYACTLHEPERMYGTIVVK